MSYYFAGLSVTSLGTTGLMLRMPMLTLNSFIKWKLLFRARFLATNNMLRPLMFV